MSVAPDLLLKSAPEVKPRATAAKTPDKPAQPSSNEPSSFSQEYARARQAKASERNDSVAKPVRERKAEQDPSAEPQPAVAAPGQSAVAESGKSLPEEPAVEGAVLDPLLMLGITGELPPVALTEELPIETDSLPVVSGSLLSSGPASMTEASFDAELDALNQLPAVRLALEMGAKENAAAAQVQAPLAQVDKATQNASQSLLASQVVQDEVPVEEVGLELPELQLEALTGKTLEALKEGTANNSSDHFVSKLNALSQAIGQQSPLATRAPVVGQPVSLQQSGWSEAVVDRVMVMSSQNLKSAEIQLDPAELGRLEVRISVNQEQSQVTFASPHAGVREALDSQMHRLREMFAQQGMNQLDVNVSDQSLNRGWQGQDSDSGKGRGNANTGMQEADDAVQSSALEVARGSSVTARGLVDYYA
ncbi:flagellar hook-length control protein FliK [Pseudomonas sp. HMWF032]|uniref:flagellar hook-length control protein FliK n=1 Tax=Pseudomonas sp. HMWF032 TaxID=2056866 RepID=UPI000D341291|nr:flagellar hook-length control protein FliK [Pseudomonas sp. HMWF032]PTS82742.1 flagellar hook-length control protein FliK [Pseudomonas sp. HMWF032]PTT72833.1 flagellar hook-length control protein FliK [Pseudomonas sp. HMWF010]